jgi:hypothetical protein
LENLKLQIERHIALFSLLPLLPSVLCFRVAVLEALVGCYTSFMQSRLLTIAVVILACAVTVHAAPPIELELVTQRGMQITAPQEWLQLLTAIGIDNVRIHAAGPGDEPRVENRGTSERPRYHVRGILTSRNELRLPGGTFSRGGRGRLKDYFERLAADGGNSLTAPRGVFGLTEKEIEAVFADLAQPIDFETKGQLTRAVIDRLQPKFALKFSVDAEADRALREAAPGPDEMKGLTSGTGLAMMLRNIGLVLRPEKLRGQPVVYRIAPASADSLDSNTLGKTNDHEMPHWPIGWELHKTPGRTAPSLFEFLNAEIDGYTLEETLSAIGPRVKIPLYLDHAALRAHQIDPANIQVRLPRTRTFYKRIIDRALTQARLGSQVRIDEAGTAFLWITR